jgi:hypothetical protein
MDRPTRSTDARPKRREWTETQARALFVQWKASGLSVPAFAAQHGFHPDRFYRWRRKFETPAAPSAPATRPALVPLVPVVATPPPAPPAAGFELACGRGRVLRIPAGFDAAALRAVLRALEEASC